MIITSSRRFLSTVRTDDLQSVKRELTQIKHKVDHLLESLERMEKDHNRKSGEPERRGEMEELRLRSSRSADHFHSLTLTAPGRGVKIKRCIILSWKVHLVLGFGALKPVFLRTPGCSYDRTHP